MGRRVSRVWTVQCSKHEAALKTSRLGGGLRTIIAAALLLGSRSYKTKLSPSCLTHDYPPSRTYHARTGLQEKPMSASALPLLRRANTHKHPPSRIPWHY